MSGASDGVGAAWTAGASNNEPMSGNARMKRPLSHESGDATGIFGGCKVPDFTPSPRLRRRSAKQVTGSTTTARTSTRPAMPRLCLTGETNPESKKMQREGYPYELHWTRHADRYLALVHDALAKN